MDVYVDLLFAVNFALNSWALWVTAKLTGSRRPLSHLFLASLCGAVYAFGPLTPWAFLFSHPASKLLLAVIMIYLAFRPRALAQLLHLLAWFLLICFTTAGVSLGLYACLMDKKPQGAMLAWGDLPMWVLGLALVVLAVTGRRFLSILENRLVHVANGAHLRIQIGELEFELEALVDSGNQLMEPFSGRPVVVVALAAVSHLLPDDIVALCQANTIWETQLEELVATDWARRIHFVPFHAVANDGGVLLGVRVDALEISCHGRRKSVKGITLALSPAGLSANDNYQALVPLRLLPTKAAERVA
mgnify:FL=1